MHRLGIFAALYALSNVGVADVIVDFQFETQAGAFNAVYLEPILRNLASQQTFDFQSQDRFNPQDSVSGTMTIEGFSDAGPGVEYRHNNAGGMGLTVPNTASTSSMDSVFNEGIKFSINRDYGIDGLLLTSRVNGHWELIANGIRYSSLGSEGNPPFAGASGFQGLDTDIFVPANSEVTIKAATDSIGLFTLRTSFAGAGGPVAVPEPNATHIVGAFGILVSILWGRKRRGLSIVRT